ncbi:MAG: hypothetical protein MUC87_18125 [Bacteroidia bacterium]|jgi:hypothetical protein|nr:hypothetical protein [Bacteroidia bacterium]
MSYTSTHSVTDTYTEARARYVMGKIYDDFTHLITRGFNYPGRDEIRKWRDDLLYLMDKKALRHFQVKFSLPGGNEEAWEYILKSDNSIQTDSKSGGKDLYDYPDSASVSIVVNYDRSNSEANEYLEKRGWGDGGYFLTGTVTSNGAYSKDGYGTINNIIKK